ncbi:hypothetical protein E4U10_007251 [Claviceps purpurea]|nr:hypothetical protein E4U10_007251 [Claviceps purpurea]
MEFNEARDRLKPSHRQDGTPFTYSAVLANSDNTENRCCDDCVCNDDYTACMGLPCYHKITSILETGSVLKTTDFDVQRFVDHQHFIILRRYDYVSQQSFTKRGSQWRVDRKRRRLARVAAPGTNYPTATTLEPLGQSASLLIKVLFLVLHKLRCERPSSSRTIQLSHSVSRRASSSSAAAIFPSQDLL